MEKFIIPTWVALHHIDKDIRNAITEASKDANVKVSGIRVLSYLLVTADVPDIYVTFKCDGNPDNIAMFIRKTCRIDLVKKLHLVYRMNIFMNEDLPRVYIHRINIRKELDENPNLLKENEHEYYYYRCSSDDGV